MKNKGFSLTEVIVALAVMSLVILGALALIVSGTKMYTKTSANVDVQTEAQLLENQLNNLIVDAECGVYAGSGADVSGFTADSYIKVYNTAVAYYVAWSSAEEKVYFLEKQVVDGAVDELTDAEKNIENWSLMGEGVTGFSPDTSHVSDSQRLVVISLEVTKGKGHYATVQNISLRNNVLESNNLSEIYSGTGVEGSITVTDVTISPKVVSLNRGSSTAFSTVVSSNGQVVPSQEVVFHVTGNISSDTYVSQDGTLYIGLDEAASIVNVTVTAKDSTVSAKASVIIPTVSGVSVSVNNTSPAAGTAAKFTASVDGSNLDEAARSILWTVDTAGLSDVSISPDGILYIGSEVPAGTEIVVRGTAAVTVGTANTVSNTCKVTVSGKSASGFSILADTTTLNRNGSLILRANLDGTDLSVSDSNVSWSIVDDAGLGGKVNISPGGILTAEKDISYTNSYEIVIKAQTTSAYIGNTYETTITIQIPAVSIVFENNAAFVVKGQTVRFPYRLYGLENAGADLSVSSKPAISNLSGTFMYCTDTELVVTIGSNVNRSNTTVTASLKGSPAVQGSVVIYIKEESNVEGTSLYAPTPADTECFPSPDQFVRVAGSDRSNVVEIVFGNKSLSYWIVYEANGTQSYRLLVDQTEYTYQADTKLWKKS